MYIGEDNNMKLINIRKIKQTIRDIVTELKESEIQYVLYTGNPRSETAIKIASFNKLKDALEAMAKGDGHYKLSQFFIREELK
jgi:hypothetical protein